MKFVGVIVASAALFGAVFSPAPVMAQETVPDVVIATHCTPPDQFGNGVCHVYMSSGKVYRVTYHQPPEEMEQI
ncbi:MAG: hypothetical protein M3Q74_01465 [Pseudomonadota bacterium]|nr:hypothetical protein [Pseudomonadota bacterium]